MRERKRKKRTSSSSSSSSSSRAIVVVVVVFVVCAFLQSSISFSSAKTITKEEEEEREQRLVVVLDGNRAENCAIERRARAVEKALLLERWPARGEEETTTTKKKKKIVLLLAADDRNDRCELLKRRLDEEKKDYFEYATLPRDALKPIGGPRTRALSVRVSNWIRERRESNSGEEEVYAYVEDDSEALMYFAAMSKETRGGATESFYDDVSFATLAGIEFSDKSISVVREKIKRN